MSLIGSRSNFWIPLLHWTSWNWAGVCNVACERMFWYAMSRVLEWTGGIPQHHPDYFGMSVLWLTSSTILLMFKLMIILPFFCRYRVRRWPTRLHPTSQWLCQTRTFHPLLQTAKAPTRSSSQSVCESLIKTVCSDIPEVNHSVYAVLNHSCEVRVPDRFKLSLTPILLLPIYVLECLERLL